MSDLKKLQDRVLKFRDERDWKQFHNPKDLAISLLAEATELLDEFKWKDQEAVAKHLKEYKESVSDEVMDVLYHVLLISADLDIDINSEFERKMLKNEKKYPIEKSKSSNKKYTELEKKMIVYSATKTTFSLDVLRNKISQNIKNLYVKETGFKPNPSEVVSWTNSMQFMKNIIDDPDIPEDAGIAIEYKIPQTSKRIDFIITGIGNDNIKTAILIELKQWSHGVSVSEKDAVVNTAFFGETNHPSYQAWSYSSLLNDYNSAVQEKNIKLEPCAYLHNYSDDDNVLSNDCYSEWIKKAPVFF